MKRDGVERAGKYSPRLDFIKYKDYEVCVYVCVCVCAHVFTHIPCDLNFLV